MGVENRRPTTFRELVEAERIDPDDVVRVFEDYVQTGAAIHGQTVIDTYLKNQMRRYLI